jgi:hypothetical protein
MHAFQRDIYDVVLLRYYLWGFCFVFIFLFVLAFGLRMDLLSWLSGCGCNRLVWGLNFNGWILVFSCFYFCFCILATYVLDLVCMKQTCSLNVIIDGLAKA